MQIESSNESRMKVAIIGTSGAGKTCFIAAMRWLGECCGDARFISVGANGDTKKYFDDLHEKVNNGEVPPGTPAEFKLEFGERYVLCDGKPPVQIDFSMQDFKGGDLRNIDAGSPLFQSWAQSDLLVVLIDIEKVKRQGIELQDDLRNILAVLIRNEMDATNKRLAVVITQADKGGFAGEKHSPETAERLLDENLHDFFERIITSGFKETKCFLLASIGLEPETGTDGRARVPEVDGRREWRPFGYEELFDWICAFQRQEEVSRFYEVLWTKSKPFVAALAVLALGGVIWCGLIFHGYTKAKAMYYNPVSSLSEKAKATWKMRDRDRIDAIEKRIANDSAMVEKTSEEKSLREVLSDIRTFSEKAKISEEQSVRIREIESKIVEKLDDALFKRIKDAMEIQSYASANDLIVQYLTDPWIPRNHREEVNAYCTKLTTDSLTKEKNKIAYYDVGAAGNTTRMNEKLKLIREFKYQSPEDEKDAAEAVKAMEKLMCGAFMITEIRAEELVNKRNTYVLIASSVSETKDLKEYKKDGVPVETKEIDSKCPQWNDDRLLHTELSWKPGQSIRVEWRRDSFLSDKPIASISSTDEWLGLLIILQPQVHMHKHNYNNFIGEPSITIKCREFSKPEEDLKRIKRFVIPGEYWKEQ